MAENVLIQPLSLCFQKTVTMEKVFMLLIISGSLMKKNVSFERREYEVRLPCLDAGVTDFIS